MRARQKRTNKKRAMNNSDKSAPSKTQQKRTKQNATKRVKMLDKSRVAFLFVRFCRLFVWRGFIVIESARICYGVEMSS